MSSDKKFITASIDSTTVDL